MSIAGLKLTKRQDAWVEEQLSIIDMYLAKTGKVPSLCFLGNLNDNILTAIQEPDEADPLLLQIGSKRLGVMADLMDADILAAWKVSKDNVFYFLLHTETEAYALESEIEKNNGKTRLKGFKKATAYLATHILPAHKTKRRFNNISKEKRFELLKKLEANSGIERDVLHYYDNGDLVTYQVINEPIHANSGLTKPYIIGTCYDSGMQPENILQRFCDTIVDDIVLRRINVIVDLVLVFVKQPLDLTCLTDLIAQAENIGFNLLPLTSEDIKGNTTFASLVPEKIMDDVVNYRPGPGIRSKSPVWH
jgi:hypothetical protein